MKAIFPTTVLAAALLMSACGDGKSDAAKEITAVNDSIKAASTVDLDQYHMPLQLELPPGSPAPTIVWKDVTGKLEVRAGDAFSLTIMEDPGDMQRLKGDLDRDLLKKNTILKETPDELVYKSEFPDDSTLTYFHFHRIVHGDGRTFAVDDMDAGKPFTRAQVERMAGSITSRKPA